MQRKAVFFDRDGVILKSVEISGKHPRTPWIWEEFAFIPHVPETLEEIKKIGFLLIVISNQPDVLLGNLSEEQWSAMHQKVQDLNFDDIFL
jgi:D-glycero-D-manno-heptose 1,7-bisphosphate phosphatase